MYIWTLTIVRLNDKTHLGYETRTIAVYASKENAIARTIDNCELLSEQGYYLWAVIEQVPVGHCHPMVNEKESVWFSLPKIEDSQSIQIDGEPVELKTVRESRCIVPWYQNIG